MFCFEKCEKSEQRRKKFFSKAFAEIVLRDPTKVRFGIFLYLEEGYLPVSSSKTQFKKSLKFG
jgi:hypothetical protein